jgi:hypothetical protein
MVENIKRDDLLPGSGQRATMDQPFHTPEDTTTYDLLGEMSDRAAT